MGKHTGMKWEMLDGNKRKHQVIREMERVNGQLHLRDRKKKYKRMAESPFAFYRGTAHLFYHDLALENLPEQSRYTGEDTLSWVMGDLHINNFGAFCDADDEVVYDLNDFDEAWVAPYVFDVWRGAASLCLQAEENGFDEDQMRRTVHAFCLRYLAVLADYAKAPADHRYAQVTAKTSDGVMRAFLEDAEKQNSRAKMLNDWTVMGPDGRRRFKEHKKLKPCGEDDKVIIIEAVKRYQTHLNSELKDHPHYFKVYDVAQRTKAGVGSYGTPRYYVLVRGETDNPDEDHILDVKEQGLPSFFHFLPRSEQKQLLALFDEDRAGFRVAMAQRAMLRDPDPTLGGMTILGRSFSVRERSPFKESLELNELDNFQDFSAMADHWGTILGTAHARGDDADRNLTPHHFEKCVTKRVGKNQQDFIEETTQFALAYAKQVHYDHELFTKLIEKKKLV